MLMSNPTHHPNKRWRQYSYSDEQKKSFASSFSKNNMRMEIKNYFLHLSRTIIHGAEKVLVSQSFTWLGIELWLPVLSVCLLTLTTDNDSDLAGSVQRSLVYWFRSI